MQNLKKNRKFKENLRSGEKIKVGLVQGFGSFLKIRESCPCPPDKGHIGGWRVRGILLQTTTPRESVKSARIRDSDNHPTPE